VSRPDVRASPRRAQPWNVISSIVLAAIAIAAAISIGFAILVLEGVITPVVGYSSLNGAVAVVVLLPAACLLVAGVVAWFGRRDASLAGIAFAAATLWLAPEWVGWVDGPLEIRDVALLLVPFVVPLAVHLPVRAMKADPVGSRARRALASLYLVVGALAVVRALTYDPWFDPDCWSLCVGHFFAVHRDDVVAARLATVLSIVALVAGAGLTGWAVLRMVRLRHADRRRQGAVLLPAGALGCAIAWSAGIRVLVTHEDAKNVVSDLPAIATSLALAAVAIGVAWSIGVVIRQATAVRRMADAIDPRSTAGSLRATLARSLGDERLRVAYAFPEGAGFIDEQGVPVPEPGVTPGRAVTAIERDGVLVALVDHAAGTHPDLLAQEIGSAARLAADNERLAAAVRARLRELQASRARIVEAGDTARGRLERDLHDGAQQRLLTLSYELRLARSAADGAPKDATAALDKAIAEVDTALVELRELAHGIYPAILEDAGLDAALVNLAEEAGVPVVFEGRDEARCPAASEAAAYLAVAEALRQARASASPSVRVRLSRSADRLRLEVRAAGIGQDPSWLRVEDRVGASGGTLTLEAEEADVTLLRVELPCA